MTTADTGAYRPTTRKPSRGRRGSRAKIASMSSCFAAQGSSDLAVLSVPDPASVVNAAGVRLRAIGEHMPWSYCQNVPREKEPF